MKDRWQLLPVIPRLPHTDDRTSGAYTKCKHCSITLRELTGIVPPGVIVACSSTEEPVLDGNYGEEDSSPVRDDRDRIANDGVDGISTDDGDKENDDRADQVPDHTGHVGGPFAEELHGDADAVEVENVVVEG